MKTVQKRGYSNIFLITVIVAIVAIGVGAGFVVIGPKRPEKKPTIPTATPQSFVLSPTPSPVQWKTYTNNFLKFSIDYPQTWFVSELDVGATFATSKENLKKEEIRKNHLRVLIVKTALLEGQTLDDYINSHKNESFNFKSKEDIVVNNVSGKQIIGQSLNFPLTKIVYLTKKDYVYTLSVTPADSELMPIFDQMLTTFKFLN